MRREDGTVMGRAGAAQERSALRRLSKREIDRRLAAIGLEVARAFEGTQLERLEYLGLEIHAIPVDTKKFVRVMSRFLIFN